MGILRWRDIVDILWSISAGLNFIHGLDLVHGHLHGGNVLIENIENEQGSIDAEITDTGLHGPVDKQMSSQPIYGVVPFVAPEIFNGSMPTKASDIYSFGMIMWMLSAGVRPYRDRPHNKQLVQEVCLGLGLRPSVVDGTPTVFSGLMLQCLDVNPSNRPTALHLHGIFTSWINTFCDEQSQLFNQFDVAEGIRFANLEKKFHILPCSVAFVNSLI